ncbi:MAG TPA: hypothetical protein VMZ90_07915 [Vicinamibacterales bacterium]|nr:hypothetical protein [Vicinamibacterales bacterium]
MMEAQSNIVSIEIFRASRAADRMGGALQRGTAGVRPHLSPRSVEHRERMLQFLRMEAAGAAANKDATKEVRAEGKEAQGRLLL